MRRKTTPNKTVSLHLRKATAPDKQQHLPEIRDAADGVCDVGCARQQSQASRSDSRVFFVSSKLRASRRKNSKSRKDIPIHTREPNNRGTSSMKNTLYHEFAVHQADDATLLATYPKIPQAKTFPAREG